MVKANIYLFLTEVIEKENANRLRWFENNYERVYKTKPPELVPEKAKVLYEEIARRRLEQHQNKVHYPKFKPESISPKPNTEIEILSSMRPVPQNELDLLEEGSEAYLVKRYVHTPSDRFYHPDASNWAYGWEAEKRIIGTSDSKLHGHRNIITTFTPRNGVHPEASFYRPPASFNFDYPFL